MLSRLGSWAACLELGCSAPVGSGTAFVHPCGVHSVMLCALGLRFVVPPWPLRECPCTLRFRAACLELGCSAPVGSGTAFVHPCGVHSVMLCTLGLPLVDPPRLGSTLVASCRKRGSKEPSFKGVG